MEVREPSAKYLARPAFKQTEVGEIPEDWNCPSVAKLAANCANAIVGGPFGSDLVSKDYVAAGVPVVRGQNMSRHYVSGDFVFVTEAKAKHLQANTARPSDIIFTQRGTLGQVSLVPDHPFERYIVSQSQMKLTLNQDLADPKYAYHYFLSADGQKQIFDSAIQTGVPHTNLGILRSYKLPIPPSLAEQQAIAATLSDANALIEALEQLLTKQHQIKQGAMQELLTGQRRLPGFAGEWLSQCLGESAILKARIGWQGLTAAEYKENGDFYLVTGTEFDNGYINWSNCFFVDESRYRQDKNIQLRLHDVLITKDGTIGKVALIDQLPLPATLNSGVFVIRPISGAFHPEFFYYLLSSEQFAGFLAQLSAGSTINHLYQKDFVGFVFNAPPTLEEQTAIAAVLSDMDAEIAALEAKLAKARQIKQGMMQELLTGRIRLVQPTAEVIPLPSPAKDNAKRGRGHNWQINEAVVIAVLAKNFGSEQWPLGRKRYTKLAYLLHRRVEHQAEGYLKKAAGPYNPATKYKGPEGIALKNGYIRQHSRDEFSGFVAAEKIAEAEDYFIKWYGEDALAWLKQFRLEKNDELELLATVDMAAEDLRRAGKSVTADNVKQIIQAHPDWQAKLDRPIFSDDNIQRAIAKCHNLFGN